MYKFKHYNNEGKFLSEIIGKNPDYHSVVFPEYVFCNDVIEIIKLHKHILGTISEQFIKKVEV